MLQEAFDLQQNAVSELVSKIERKQELTFRAPTGSGKTRMMADFMNRILSTHDDIIFIVSTLSKGNLAEQNYRVFKDCADRRIFPKLNPILISSEAADEERIFIPTDGNVYVLPRDLYKDKSKLKDQGVLLNFLQLVSTNLFGNGLNKKIYLIKDECHQATNNLDELKNYFDKIINMSATPNLARGQNPDVIISDEEAVNAKLIKDIEWGDDSDSVEKAICKFEEIKKDYRNLLGVNPCLIIQISNKDKAEEEWRKIESILNKTEHQHLKWMSIVDKKSSCKTNDKVGKLPVSRWKDYARDNASTIDIIIFKMVISEGWDIPRACMLYQVRDTQSKQLDKQVMGRIRRNPRLLDFEKISDEAKKLATTAWVWGIKPESTNKVFQVKLCGNETDIASAITLKTTNLKDLTQKAMFDVDGFLEKREKSETSQNIFILYADLRKSNNDIQEAAYRYSSDSVKKWLKFCGNIQDIKQEFDKRICNYTESMEITKDADGNEKLVSFPNISLYVETENSEHIANWIWKRMDNANKFSFDSEAEQEWASILRDLPCERIGRINLWGKNFPANSDIKFEYYLNGIHSSYPDFIMKDKHGTIHIFEVKSVNISNKVQIDTVEYKKKILALEECYSQCSKLTDYIFYLPIKKDDVWQITRLQNGEKDVITLGMFEDLFLESSPVKNLM